MKSRHLLVLTLLLAATLAAPVTKGQEEEKSAAERALPRMTESQVVDEVQKALPKWDKEILSPSAGPKWSARVGFGEVLKAAGDTELKTPAPKNARRVVDGERVLRVIPEHGVVRYVNRSLTWSPEKESKLVDNDIALRTASNALSTLGLPQSEMAKPRVDTQGGRDASNTSPDDSRTYEMYRLVTANRRVSDLPVLGSRARVAVAGSGGIQRMRVKWPPFNMPRGLRLRPQETVAKEIVAQIMKQDPVSLAGVPESDLTKFVSAKLAYAPQEMTRPDRRKPGGKDTEKALDEKDPLDADADDKATDRPVQFTGAGKAPVVYIPVVLVTVAASPTPYQLVVALTENR
jgi:hypothetical protein